MPSPASSAKVNHEQIFISNVLCASIGVLGATFTLHLCKIKLNLPTAVSFTALVLGEYSQNIYDVFSVMFIL